MTADVWWQQFSVQAFGGAAGTLLVSALSALSPKVREKLWKPIGRGLRWLTTVRLTTSGKVEAEEARHADEIRQLKQLHTAETAEARAQGRSEGVVQTRAETEQAAVDAIEHARAEGHAAGRAAVASEMQPRLFEQYAKGRTEAQAEAETAIKDARAESWAAGRAKGYAAGRAEATSSPPASARPDVVVEPVWRITRIDATNYWLENVQEGVGQIGDVRIRTVIGEFAFTSGNQWPGPWGKGAAFSGELVSTGVKLGARMEISWTGPSGRQHEADARIEPPPREPRRGVIL